jgi:hypothetical protein
MRFVSLAAVLLLFASSGCGKTATTDPLAPNAVTTMNGVHEGQSITLRGKVSTSPWQHLMSGVQDKQEAYFDLQGGKEQTIVYWKEPPCRSKYALLEGAARVCRRGRHHWQGHRGARSVEGTKRRREQHRRAPCRRRDRALPRLIRSSPTNGDAPVRSLGDRSAGDLPAGRPIVSRPRTARLAD